ncbi:MAG: accessory gene regulator B family protein [Clostridia bacterium]|nr:accessory gene regulator B family protein [Clostridia bacterium]MDD4375691.1 accessory gene regulator B family protein [Clostridia bacterium]
MLEQISNNLLKLLSDENDTSKEKEILLFGITRIVEDVPKYIVLILICLFLGVIKELAIVYGVIIAYKSFVGGVHLKTNIGCFIWTLISNLSCIYIPKLFDFAIKELILIYILIYIFSNYVIIVYVPADVPEMPIVNKKRRKRDKTMSFIMLNVLYLIAILLIKNYYYSNIIIITILSIDIMTVRVVYKLFKNEYGHETYIPKNC